MRTITHVDGTYAHPCGCVAEGKPERVTEACGKRSCLLAWIPTQRQVKHGLARDGRTVCIRGRL